MRIPALYMEVETTQSPDTFLRLISWLHANRKRIIIGLIAAAVIGLSWGLYSWNKTAREDSADAQLLSVQGVVGMSARVTRGSLAPLLDVARRYPNTPGGEYAQLLGAETLFTDGKYSEAQSEFSRYLADYPDGSLVAQAKMGVAASVEAQGKTAEAIQKYQEVVKAYSSETSIVSPAKLTLARLYEEDNKPQQALPIYAQLAQIRNPNDPWAAEARERAELLLAKHPEFRKLLEAPAPKPFALPQNSAAAPAAANPSQSAPSPATSKPGANPSANPGALPNSAAK
jgi:predicted negative regulator of RcsB-dependent stress response